MTDHEIPEPQPPRAPGPGAAGEGPELVAVRVALAAVPDPPADQLEHALRVALAAYDEAHGQHPSGADRSGEEGEDGKESGSGREDAVVPLPRRRTGGAATHRRRAAVAAALVVLAGLAGLLVARNPLRSTVGDTSAMSAEASLDRRATTTVAPPTAAAAPSAATASPAPTTTAPADALTASAASGAQPTLGSYADAAALLARVRAEAAAPVIAGAPTATAEDNGSLPGGSGAVCGTPEGASLGDAVIGATRVLVVLETMPTGTSSEASRRIRVYVAANCGLLLDEPLTG